MATEKLKAITEQMPLLKEANKAKTRNVSVDSDTATVQTGDVLQLNVTLMRSFIHEQMCSANSFIREACGLILCVCVRTSPCVQTHPLS